MNLNEPCYVKNSQNSFIKLNSTKNQNCLRGSGYTYSFPLDDPRDFIDPPFTFDGLVFRSPFILLDRVGGFWLGELGD